ncbi:Dynamin [Penicillium lividum]|nr:Dynamin [Penicillium lividum]
MEWLRKWKDFKRPSTNPEGMLPKTEKSEYLGPWLRRKSKRKSNGTLKLAGPWLRRNNQDEEDFVTLFEKSEVQNAIMWAQLAILNPTSDSQLLPSAKPP